MKLRWILPPLALLILAAVLWIRLHEARTAASLLASAERRLAPGEERDPGGALRELTEALQLAGLEGDLALRAEILRVRSKLYRSQRLPVLALADCQTLLAEFGPEESTLELASQLALELGDPGPALEFARELSRVKPDAAQGWIGESHVALGDLPLAKLEAHAREVLSQESAGEASRQAQRAAVFAGDEAVSAAARDECLDRFENPDDRRLVAELIAEAGAHLQAARAAFVASLDPRPTAGAIAGLQDLLLRAGADLQAADLGSLALELQGLQPKMPILARTAGALARLGREDAARMLILAVGKRDGAALRPQLLSSNELRNELREWCTLLDDLGLWNQLADAAGVLADRADQRKDSPRLLEATFLTGMAELRAGRPESARRYLDGLALRVPRGETRVRTWLALSEIARQQKQRAQERYALLLGTQVAPLDPRGDLRKEIGEAWLRVSEIQRQDGGSGFLSLTHALRCLPDRAAELEPIWHERGRTTLQDRWHSGPYNRFVFARWCLESGQYARAIVEAEGLLGEFPGLAPALEIALRGSYRQGDYGRGIAVALEILERGISSPEASARLRATPPQQFQREDRMRWLRLDPRGSLDGIVRHLLAQGRFDGAVLAARGSPAQFQPPETQSLLARVLYEAGDPRRANEIVSLIQPKEPGFRAAAGLVLRLGLHASEESGQPGPLGQALRRVLQSGVPQDPELLGAADALLSAGRFEEAATLLGWIESQETPWTGEHLLRTAVLRAIRREAAAIDETLERAVPFFDDGRGEVGRLVIAADREDWSGLQREAQVALATPLVSSSKRRSFLLALKGDLAGAAEELAGARLDGLDPALVLGVAALRALDPESFPSLKEDGEQSAPELPPALANGPDPRALLVLALASEIAPWSSWTLARVAELPAEVQAEPWLAVMRALSRLSLGEAAGAERDLESIPLPGPLPGPSPGPSPWRDPVVAAAWHLRATLLAAHPLRPDPERVLDLELGWLAASGLGNSDDPGLAVLQAAALRRAGDREAAVRCLELALERESGDPRLWAALAKTEHVPGRRTRAISLYRDLFERFPGQASSTLLLEALDALRAARDGGEISEQRWWNELEALEALLPREPAVVRELAERAFERRPDAVPQGPALALERIDRFRERTLQEPIETLRAGEARRWTQMLARTNPELALRFAREELGADPIHTGLWRNCCEALIAAGHWSEALEELEALQRVAPERETVRLNALTRMQVEADPADFLARLKEFEQIDEGAKSDPQFAFYSVLALLGKSRGEVAAGLVARGLELWNARAQNGLSEPGHARAFALGLFRAGYTEAALEVLQGAGAEAVGLLDRDVLAGLDHLMRARLLEPNPPVPRGEPGADKAAATDDAAAARKAKALKNRAGARGKQQAGPGKKPAGKQKPPGQAREGG